MSPVNHKGLHQGKEKKKENKKKKKEKEKEKKKTVILRHSYYLGYLGGWGGLATATTNHHLSKMFCLNGKVWYTLLYRHFKQQLTFLFLQRQQT